MTVRWKPLLIMSGLFLVVAVGGVIAMALTLAPSVEGVKRLARTAREARRFEDAEIRYKQALQLDAKDASIHEEFASLYEEWGKDAPESKRDDLRAQRINHLMKAANYDKSLKGPRVRLLTDAMFQENGVDAVYWAKEVIALEPENLDAHYVLAAEGVEAQTPDIAEIRKHLGALEAKKAPFARQAWIRAKLAEITHDDAVRDEVFAKARTNDSEKDKGVASVERMALLRLTALEIQVKSDLANQPERVQRLIRQGRELTAEAGAPAVRLVRVAALLDFAQRVLSRQAAKGSEAEKAAVPGQIDLIEAELETTYKKALEAPAIADLQVYLSYADHLRFRQQQSKCLEVIRDALAKPQASRPAAIRTALGLHAIAVEVALAKNDEQSKRFELAKPHVDALIASSDTRYQGLGHLFQGSMDLEQSGIVVKVDQAKPSTPTTTNTSDRVKLRNSAITHLGAAAERLPDVAEAQARYGVALLLSGEQNLGRQFLQKALGMGNLDAQYQLWAAWAILQGGYPEEAEPIVNGLFDRVADGSQPASILGTLQLIRGEILQAKNTPADLNKASEAFEQAMKNGQSETPQVVLRLAQIDVQQKRFDKALSRLEQLRKKGSGGPAVEQLAVLALEEQGKKDEARKLVKSARDRFPDSSELAGLQAALLTRDQKFEDADRLLADFIAKQPETENLVMMRAQLLSESLKRPEEAMKVLSEFADRAVSSGPIVMLTMMQIERNDLEAASATIAKVRKRWKDGATADVLDAQLSLRKKDIPAAREHFAQALKKDPNNKIVQYWKAQLDSQAGQVGEAAQTLESIAVSKPVKEVESGVTLANAAQSALANISLKSGKFDEAIRRFEELKRGSQSGTLGREDRWQLITAYVAKGEWDVAKRDLAAILNDANQPPTDDERVRGSNFYRQNKEETAAQAQLDYVLAKNPSHAAAAVTTAFFQNRAKKGPEAIAVLRKAIEQTRIRKEKVAPVLFIMLAAIEHENAKPSEALAHSVKVLDEGLAADPNSTELIQAKYYALSSGGDKKGALTFIEGLAKSNPSEPIRRLLVQTYRDLRDYEAAERELRELFKQQPKDGNLAAAIIQVVSLQASTAAARAELEKEKKLNDSVEQMIRDFKKQFPGNPVFLQAECDLAARHGDVARAIAITHEIDKLDKESSLGAVLRARIFASAGRGRESAEAYAEAVERRPRELDLHLLLGKAKLQIGEVDEALAQAKFVLDIDNDQQDAVMLQARALMGAGTSDSERQAAVTKAAAVLSGAVKADPKFIEAAHLLAEAEFRLGRRPEAVTVLRENLKANPEDGEGLALLVQTLAQGNSQDPRGSSTELGEAKKIVEEVKGRDKKGSLFLAAAVGFHKSGHFDLAEPLAEKAATMLDSPGSHLNYGDLLLSMAEASAKDQAKAREYFLRAVAQYDAVLKTQPNSVEAINNKAWILHSYLGENAKALELTESFLKRMKAASLPGEFYDTLGAIQEGAGRTREAEESYQAGLRKAPDHPVLHYHFGKLISGDRSRANLAKTHLSRALAARDRLNPAMAEEAARLVASIGGASTGN